MYKAKKNQGATDGSLLLDVCSPFTQDIYDMWYLISLPSFKQSISKWENSNHNARLQTTFVAALSCILRNLIHSSLYHHYTAAHWYAWSKESQSDYLPQRPSLAVTPVDWIPLTHPPLLPWCCSSVDLDPPESISLSTPAGHHYSHTSPFLHQSPDKSTSISTQLLTYCSWE